MQKHIKWYSFKRPPIKQKCLALQEYWEENIPSHLKVEEDMFFSVQSTKNIAKFLFLTSQPQWVGQWEGEWAGPAGLTPRELNDPPGQPYSEQPTWFGGRRARAKSLQSALRGGGSGHAFCHSVFVYSELLARPLAQYDSHRRRRSDDLFWFGKIR